MVISFIGNDLQLFVGGSCLINDICVCLHILASKTCYIVSLFCLSSSCVRSVASFFGLSIYDCPIQYSLSFIYSDSYDE